MNTSCIWRQGRNWLFYLYVVSMVALMLYGCASNNPSGPDASSPAATATATNTGTASYTITIGALAGRIVSGSGGGLPGMVVSLYNTTGGLMASPFTTTGDGGYAFNKIDAGFYVIKVYDPASPAAYLTASTIVYVESEKLLVADDLAMPEISNFNSQRTLDIEGTVISPLDNMPLSVAEVTLDTGIKTVTDSQGYFYLPFAKEGSRILTIKKPSMADFSLSFEVVGGTGADVSIAQKISFQGKDYTPVANPYNGNKIRLVKLGSITALYELNAVSAFIGTVMHYVSKGVDPISNRTIYALEPLAYFPFNIWWIDPDKIVGVYRHVVTNGSGTYKVDNVPPTDDNDYGYFAIADGTTMSVSDGQSGKTVTANPPTGMYTSGYRARGGLTTIMDIVVPETSTTPGVGGPTVLPPVLGNPVANPLICSIASSVTFDWAPSTNVTNYQFVMYKAGTPNSMAYSKTFTKAVTSTATMSHTVGFPQNNIGIGAYYWTVGAVDPNTADLVYANVRWINVAPLSSELMPPNNTNVQITAANSSIEFRAPPDSNATRITLEIFNSNGDLIMSPTTTNGAYTLAFTSANPAPASGTVWHWHARYSYSGAELRSDDAYLTIITNNGIPTVAAPTLVSPAGLLSYTSTDAVPFQWNTVANASTYQLAIKNGLSGTNNFSYIATITSSAVAGTTLTQTVGLAANGLNIGPYVWAVGAIDSSGNIAYSSYNTFFVKPRPQDLNPGPNGIVTTSSVATTTATFSWPGDPNCTYVFVDIKDRTRTQDPPFVSGTSRVVTNTSTTQLATTFLLTIGTTPVGAPDQFSWRVRYYYPDFSTPVDSDWVDFDIAHQ